MINRKGEKEPVKFDRIADRVKILMGSAYGGPLEGLTGRHVMELTQDVIGLVGVGMTTSQIDELVVSKACAYSATNSAFSALAARVQIDGLQKTARLAGRGTLLGVLEHLLADSSNRLDPQFVALVRRFSASIEKRIKYSRDFINVGFSASTLARSYLMRDAAGEIAELPQHMYMRVALAITCLPMRDLDDEGLAYLVQEAFDVYDLLSLKKISHASPTIFNSGTRGASATFDQLGRGAPSLASCYLMQVDDSMRSLLDVAADGGVMSKNGGGLGICLTRMRGRGEIIRSSGGLSKGVGGYLRLLNTLQSYADQGSTRRGAFAVYLEMWHADIEEFLIMPRASGPLAAQGANAPDIKYGLWVPDRFWLAAALEASGADPVTVPAARWYLFSPNTAPGLDEVFDERSVHHADGPGGTFSDRLDGYRAAGLSTGWVAPSRLLGLLAQTISQVGFPYVLNKDNVNRKSNLSHAQTITNSNLCAEITIPCRTRDEEPGAAEYAVCNLAALNLEAFVRDDLTAPGGAAFDFAGTIAAAGQLATNLDRVISYGGAPVPGCDRSNSKYRAIAIGVMGLADVFFRLGLPFDSPEALALDEAIHAAIYYGATRQSALLGAMQGSFPAFVGSPASRGLLGPDLWVAEGSLDADWEARICAATGGLLDSARWVDLRFMVATGLRNGYVTATMPTATSSNAVGVNECIEPVTTLNYTRKTSAGEFVLLNHHFERDMRARELWSPELRDALVESLGSVASFDGLGGRPLLSDELRRLYRTAREIDPLVLVAHSAARGPFISQSQSLNFYTNRIETKLLEKIWLAGWARGLGTGSYYIHSAPGSGTLAVGKTAAAPACPIGAGPDCTACSV